MTRDDIMRMAREAGYGEAMADLHATALERFAAVVASAKQQAMQAEGWRQCAVGQRVTQHCAMAERDTALLRQALAAMEAYDQRGTAALMWDAIAALRERLGGAQ